VGSLWNALHKWRRRVPKGDFSKNKHQDCIYYYYGVCKFFHFTDVDPKGSACPNFEAKKKTETQNPLLIA